MGKTLGNTRILIADSESVTAKKLALYLRESGFDTKVMNSNYLVQKEILEWRPHMIFIDLMFPGFYALDCLQFLKRQGLKKSKVIVMSAHNDPKNVKACIDQGAQDFIVKPLQPLEVLNRLMLLLRSKDMAPLKVVGREESEIGYYFQMMEILVQTTTHKKSAQSIRFELCQMVSLALKGVRTSVIEFEEKGKNLRVTCSSDDANLTNLALDLQKYPELQYILRTEKPLFIENIADDMILSTIQQKVQTIAFNSMIVLPIHHGTRLVGALSIRMPDECSQLAVWDIKIGSLVGQLVAMTWKFKPVGALKKAS